MTVTDKQVRMMQEVMNKDGRIGVSAAKSGMCRQTASKYNKGGKLPSELKKKRTWRTRSNPIDLVWDEVQTMLINAPALLVIRAQQALRSSLMRFG